MRAAAEPPLPREKVAEIETLATALAARLRYAQIVSLPVPREQVAALARAAALLTEARVPLSSLVRQVLREEVEGPPRPKPAAPAPGTLARLGRHLRSFRTRLPEMP